MKLSIYETSCGTWDDEGLRSMLGVSHQKNDVPQLGSSIGTGHLRLFVKIPDSGKLPQLH